MLLTKRTVFTGVAVLFIGLLSFVFNVNAQATMEKTVLTGKVINTQTDKAVSDVKVKLSNTQKAATTDDKGRFRFTGLEPGSYTIKTNPDDFKKYKKQVEVPGIGKNLTIELQPSKTTTR